MYLNTLGKHQMYMSVAEILGIDIEIIRRFVKENADKIVRSHYDEHSIGQMNLDNLTSDNTLKRIDSLIVNHITPRNSYKSIWEEGLLTLPHALTRKTELSDYLRELGFKFSFNERQIIMSRNGRVVDVGSKEGTNLRLRLGGVKMLTDYNINGYLFVDEFIEEAVRGWLGSPEFLKSLSIYYNDHSIADNYINKGDNYYVSFEVPLEKIDIEAFSDKTSECRKTGILLRYTINALAYAEIKRKPSFSMHNPIIFLKRDYNVPKEDIRKIWRLQYNNPRKWIPVEIDEVVN